MMIPTKIPTVPELRAHALALAKAFDAIILETPGFPVEQTRANWKLRAILMPPIKDETTYAVALHELGHIAAPGGSGIRAVAESEAQFTNLLLDEEMAAWEWAEHYALDWTVSMEMVKTLALGGYEAYRTAVHAKEAA